MLTNNFALSRLRSTLSPICKFFISLTPLSVWTVEVDGKHSPPDLPRRGPPLVTCTLLIGLLQRKEYPSCTLLARIVKYFKADANTKYALLLLLQSVSRAHIICCENLQLMYGKSWESIISGRYSRRYGGGLVCLLFEYPVPFWVRWTAGSVQKTCNYSTLSDRLCICSDWRSSRHGLCNMIPVITLGKSATFAACVCHTAKIIASNAHTPSEDQVLGWLSHWYQTSRA